MKEKKLVLNEKDFFTENRYIKKSDCVCLEKPVDAEDALKYIALYRIDEITFEEKAPRKEALENVIASMSIPGANFVYMIVGDAKGVSFYYGVAKDMYDRLEKRNAVISDATCPKVKRIHKIVSDASENGRFVVIIGMHNHPEVEAVCGWCGEHIVCENLEELAAFADSQPDFGQKAITMVIQTTQTRTNFTECANFLKKLCTNAEIFDTICGATSTRQEEASKLSAQCDAMVVIGGKHSANSVHLAEICQESCENVLFISNADELDMNKLCGMKTVGVTAGASAPAWIIKEVSNKMSEEIKIDEKAIERLKRKIILQENMNLKTKTMSDQQMVSWIKKKIEEEAQCYFNR